MASGSSGGISTNFRGYFGSAGVTATRSGVPVPHQVCPNCRETRPIIVWYAAKVAKINIGCTLVEENSSHHRMKNKSNQILAILPNDSPRSHFLIFCIAFPQLVNQEGYLVDDIRIHWRLMAFIWGLGRFLWQNITLCSRRMKCLGLRC